MGMITRKAAREIDEYVASVVNDKDYTIPSDTALRGMSSLLDASMERCYRKAAKIVSSSEQVQKSILNLKNGPRTCGKSSYETSVMKRLTSFEQMSAVSTYVDTKKINKVHTLSLATADQRFVPLRINPLRSGGSATSMTIFLGSTQGKLKAPKYSDWANVDPMGTEADVFIDPLNSLEIVRQPECLWSLVAKATSYEHQMTNKWRYRVYDDENLFARVASVELPGQKLTKAMLIKEQSAGHNLSLMISKKTYRSANLLQKLNYEDYASDEYRDDSYPVVTPKAIVKAFSKALKNDTAKLDQYSQKLFATRLGISSILQVRDYVAETLFSDEYADGHFFD